MPQSKANNCIYGVINVLKISRKSKLRSFFIFPGNQLLLGSKDNHKPLERRRRWNYKGFYSFPHHEVKRKTLVYDTELLALMSQSTNTKKPVTLRSAATNSTV